MRILSLSLIIISLAAINLAAIEQKEVEHVTVNPPVRDSLAYYHGEGYDYLFYSQEEAEFIWAVHFDFTSYYSGLDSLYFLAQGAYIYIPLVETSSELKAKLCVNVVNQPGTELFSAVTINSTAGWNFIPFPENTVQDVWLLVDYETDPETDFIAASVGDGVHSFYFEDNYYHNMSANGFEAEFLFDLYGSFLFPDFEVEVSLEAFELVGNFGNDHFSLSETVYPEFSIRNNTQNAVDTLFIKYERIRPDTFYIDSLYFYDFQPEAVIELDSTDTAEYALTLLDYPSQYIFRATIYAEGDEFAFNNTGSHDFNTFNLERDLIMLENAVRLDQYSPQIWNSQAGIVDQDLCQVMNFFANISDIPYYNIDSVNRYNFYDLGNYPVTIIEGTDKIIGYIDPYYEENLLESYDSAQQNKGFVDYDSLYSTYNEISGDAELTLYLRNVETRLFSTYLHNCYFYAVVVEDSLEIRDNIFGSVLLNVLAETRCDSLSYDNRTSFGVNFNLEDDIPYIESFDNCRLIFWIQHHDNKKIHYVYNGGYLSDWDFDLVTETAEDDIQSIPFTVTPFPNPAVRSDCLFVDLDYPRDVYEIGIRIYNLKGQFVREIEVFPEEHHRSAAWDFRDHNGHTVGSGIYFLKTSFESADRSGTLIDKIVFIRD